MPRESINVKWKREQLIFNINPILQKYENYLRSKDYRPSSILRYRDSIKIYLNEYKNIKPSIDDAISFRVNLLNSSRKRSTINLYSAAIKQFHRMFEEEVDLPYLKVNNKIPYYLTSEDILKIFSVINNLKHYAMLNLSFYCMLRASELTNLNDDDLDIRNMTLRVRNGKGGKDALLPISPDCLEILRRYLEIRPKIVLQDHSIPIFPTDYCNRWERRDLYRMFIAYKKKAGINIPGGTHLLRHSAATILIMNGCDIMSVKELMRHERLETTARYIHVAEGVREKYNKYLTL